MLTTCSSIAALARREEESLAVPTKRRRVTAEMEGKYIINMPKGTTPRTRKILEQQQAAKGIGHVGIETAFPFCCIVWGWSRPTGTGPESGSSEIQGALAKWTVLVAIEEEDTYRPPPCHPTVSGAGFLNASAGTLSPRAGAWTP